MNENGRFGGFFTMSWNPTARELNDAHVALPVKTHAAYNDIEIISYESNTSKARQTGHVVRLHEIRVFAVGH